MPMPLDISFFVELASPKPLNDCRQAYTCEPGATFVGHTLSHDRQSEQAERLPLCCCGLLNMPKLMPMGPGMK